MLNVWSILRVHMLIGSMLIKKKHVAQILAVKGVAEGFSKPVKEAKFVTKIFLANNVELSSKYL